MTAEPLYMTEGEIAAALRMSAPTWRKTALRLESEGFPRRDPLFANRRYWPACKAFLDERHGLNPDSSNYGDSSVEAMENWD